MTVACMRTVCLHRRDALAGVFGRSLEILVYSGAYSVVLLWECVSVGNCGVFLLFG